MCAMNIEVKSKLQISISSNRPPGSPIDMNLPTPMRKRFKESF